MVAAIKAPPAREISPPQPPSPPPPPSPPARPPSIRSSRVPGRCDRIVDHDDGAACRRDQRFEAGQAHQESASFGTRWQGLSSVLPQVSSAGWSIFECILGWMLVGVRHSQTPRGAVGAGTAVSNNGHHNDAPWNAALIPCSLCSICRVSWVHPGSDCLKPLLRGGPVASGLEAHRPAACVRAALGPSPPDCSRVRARSKYWQPGCTDPPRRDDPGRGRCFGQAGSGLRTGCGACLGCSDQHLRI
jgi:hypothetical protein